MQRRKLILPIVALILALTGTARAEDLAAEAKKIARDEVGKLGSKYSAQVDPHRHLIFISALDSRSLQQTRDLLLAYTDAQRRTLLGEKPQWNITIILPTKDDYENNFNPPKGAIGYYQSGKKRVISIDRGRTLIHEFTHALHAADASAARQVHPMWVKEGLATLFERAKIGADGLTPLLDTRLLTVQRAIRKEELLELEDLLKMDRKRFYADRHRTLAYAQARYLMYYLHEKGKLQAWYKEFKRTCTGDPTGRQALQRVLSAQMFRIQKDWTRWVGRLKLPAAERRSGQARLGAIVAVHPQGVKIVTLPDGSAAKQAGRLKVGDVITRIDGKPVRNMAEFVAAVRSCRAMQTVTIILKRHGRTQTIQQPLGQPDSASMKAG
ncbi:MAG: PDZ domain-containing protein [Phycisphaerae bacterium]